MKTIPAIACPIGLPAAGLSFWWHTEAKRFGTKTKVEQTIVQLTNN